MMDDPQVRKLFAVQSLPLNTCATLPLLLQNATQRTTLFLPKQSG